MGTLKVIGASCVLLALLVAAPWPAEAGPEFGLPGGPQVEETQAVGAQMDRAPADLELILSFGTAPMLSGGHVAVAIRAPGESDMRVYTANFAADRAPEHASGYHVADLVCCVPRLEYLFGTVSSLGPDAWFGSDFGQVFKRTAIGIRVHGVPPEHARALAAFFARMNDDYHHDRRHTDYERGRIAFDYFNLNCAKIVGLAFQKACGYVDLKVKGESPLAGIRPLKYLHSNLPTEMALKLMECWHNRGYAMETVFYVKCPVSTYVNGNSPYKLPYKDQPNRFPSLFSLDFFQDADHYEGYGNLCAMALLGALNRYVLHIDPVSHRLVLDESHQPLPYAQAKVAAVKQAQAAHRSVLVQLAHVLGSRLGPPADHGPLVGALDGLDDEALLTDKSDAAP